MPDLATTPRARTVARHLTERDWQPALSSAVEGTVSRQVTLGAFDAVVSAAPTASLGLAGSEPAWLKPTLRILDDLLRLEPGWNSYRAAPIRPELASALLELLFEIMDDDTPPPSVVPTATGGVQAEWHRKGYDFEIEVLSPSRFVAHFEDVESGEIESRAVVSDLRPLIEWIALISD